MFDEKNRECVDAADDGTPFITTTTRMDVTVSIDRFDR
jgi:hypothetical protein